MSQAIIVSDDLYARLEQSARHRGLVGIASLLEAWQTTEDERQRRRAAVQEIRAIRERMHAVYGDMPDSVDWILEDRTR